MIANIGWVPLELPSIDRSHYFSTLDKFRLNYTIRLFHNDYYLLGLTMGQSFLLLFISYFRQNIQWNLYKLYFNLGSTEICKNCQTSQLAQYYHVFFPYRPPSSNCAGFSSIPCGDWKSCTTCWSLASKGEKSGYYHITIFCPIHMKYWNLTMFKSTHIMFHMHPPLMFLSLWDEN